MNLFAHFISLRGRLARAGFLARLVVLGAGFLALFLTLDATVSHRATLVLYPPLFWALLSLSLRRLHDRDRSAPWLLLALVPLAGPLWLLVELFLLPGTPGENRYGADPLAATGDYLVVGR